jgi:hypothetical protein
LSGTGIQSGAKAIVKCAHRRLDGQLASTGGSIPADCVEQPIKTRINAGFTYRSSRPAS